MLHLKKISVATTIKNAKKLNFSIVFPIKVFFSYAVFRNFGTTYCTILRNERKKKTFPCFLNSHSCAIFIIIIQILWQLWPINGTPRQILQLPATFTTIFFFKSLPCLHSLVFVRNKFLCV